MIYHEKADIKTYKRKTKHEDKEFNQVNLGYESEFKKGEDIVVLKLSDFNSLLELDKTNKELSSKVENLENELIELKEENKKYSNQLLELSKSNNNLNNELSNEKDLRTNIIMRYEGIISDIQNKWFFKLFGRLPESYNKLRESNLIEIESKK